MSDQPRRTFTREEVQEILRRATEAASVATDDGIRHEELLEAAREAGLDPNAIAAAATELEEKREVRRDLEDAKTEIAEERRRGFLQGLSTYLLVGAFLLGINLTIAPGVWAAWVLSSWGLFVALRGLRLAMGPDTRTIERRAEKKRRRRKEEQRKAKLKREAEEWAERLRGEMAASTRRVDAAARASRNFEEAVDAGVQALLGVLSRRIREVAAAAEAEVSRPASDFNRYVDRQRRKSGADVPPAAKVRVELGPARPAAARVRESDTEDASDEDRRSEQRKNTRR